MQNTFSYTRSDTGNRSGQALVLTALSIGGTLLAVTGIAGLVMLHQIRQTTDLLNSTQAFYAADTALEWGSYQYSRYSGADPAAIGLILSSQNPIMPIGGAATFSLRCLDDTNTQVNTDGPPRFTSCFSPETQIIRSFGRNHGASRSLRISIGALLGSG